jgi:hypothetical protein
MQMLLVLLLTTISLFLPHHLTIAALKGRCNPDGRGNKAGVCLYTSDCARKGGRTTDNDCPFDGNGIKCCYKDDCYGRESQCLWESDCPLAARLITGMSCLLLFCLLFGLVWFVGRGYVFGCGEWGEESIEEEVVVVVIKRTGPSLDTFLGLRCFLLHLGLCPGPNLFKCCDFSVI